MVTSDTVGIEEITARARALAATLSVDPAGSEAAFRAAEVLRSDSMNFFSRVPEPPVYRRRDDPALSQAQALLSDGEKLLARAYALGSMPELRPWALAVERHVAALALVAEGKIEAAEVPWHDAISAEREAMNSKRLWSLSDDRSVPVYDKASTQSRFDPAPEVSMRVKLVCPQCQKADDHSCSPRHATHQFTCRACSARFTAYFGEVRSCEVQPLAKGRRYVFRLEEWSGAQTQLHVDDEGRDALAVARRDRLAFLYLPENTLRGVLNLSSSRVLWLASSRCFVATVAFGERAPELTVLRRFRDEVLAKSVSGRAFTGWYYRNGERLAAFVGRHEVIHRVVRHGLRAVVVVLQTTRERPRREPRP